MAPKTLELNNLDQAVRRAGVPGSAEEASRLADAAAAVTASLRQWVSAAYQRRARGARKAEGIDAAEWSGFAEHVTALAHQFMALQLQVIDVDSEAAEESDPLAVLRYLIARRAFASDAEMAEELGVHRSQITRWKQGAAPDAQNAERLVGLDVVVSLLQGFLEVESTPKWLRGINAHLGNRRPLDVLREGRLSEVIRAIEAEKAGAFA